MTQKLIKISVCDRCGNEVREPETTSVVTLSVIKQSAEDAVMDVHNGASFELCDSCTNLPEAAFLRLDGITTYIPGTLEFAPTMDNGNPVVAEPRPVSSTYGGRLTVLPDDEQDEEEDEEKAEDTETKPTGLTCPFCGYGPGNPQSVANHIMRTHQNQRTLRKVMAEMFPTGKFAREEAEKARRRSEKKPRYAKSNLQFVGDELAG
jgi:ssDNA-binding Zn-finger/Zn-ribbon topoisomerase 1